MFAALYSATPTGAAALVDVARAFSPRYESFGPLVVLDAGGLTRLFGSAHELGGHLLRELLTRAQSAPSVVSAASVSSAAPVVSASSVSSVAPVSSVSSVSVASTASAAAMLALSGPGLHIVPIGGEAAALSVLEVSVLAAFERLRLQAAPAAQAPTSSRPHDLTTPRPHDPKTSRPQDPKTPRPQDPRPSHPQASEGGWNHPRHTHQASRTRGARAPLPHPAARVGPTRQAEADMRVVLDVLRRWGIRTLGALAALPRPEVHERLGAIGVAWQRLAMGEDSRPLVPQVDEDPFEAVLELEWPIEGLEPLSFVLARLLEPLSLRLEQADRGAAVLHTVLRLTTKTACRRTLQLPAPMRDAKTLRTLILLDLESHPPDAPIDTVRVLIEPTPGRVLQWSLLERAQPAPEQVSTLVARLTALMGEGHVGSPQQVDAWRPGAFAMEKFSVQSGPPSVSANDASPTSMPSALGTSPAARSSVPSALRRFRLPVPARVQMREGRPVRVSTDRHGLSSGTVIQSAGPWRTSGEWWATAPSVSSAVPSASSSAPSLGFASSVSSATRVSASSVSSAAPVFASSASSAARVSASSVSSAARVSASSVSSAAPVFASSASSAARVSASSVSSVAPVSAPSVSWDRDEWDVVLDDGTVYRLYVEREVGQWFLEGTVD